VLTVPTQAALAVFHRPRGRGSGAIRVRHSSPAAKTEAPVNGRSEPGKSLMRSIEQAIDPEGILNRGKVI
jgi:FAD/FMN-containing dehydrogenase